MIKITRKPSGLTGFLLSDKNPPAIKHPPTAKKTLFSDVVEDNLNLMKLGVILMAPVNPKSIKTQCCIVGGGPAGMMLGLLLARSGIKTVVLEKHNDFFRDFRGDTIHPSTMELMHELGILKEFLQQPHQPIITAYIAVNGQMQQGPDFSTLPTQAKFIAMMPQWDFLNFIAQQAAQYPGFDLHMGAEVTELIEENAAVKGVLAQTQHGSLHVHADLVIGADGRNSIVRTLSKMTVIDNHSPIDVLWFRLNKPKTAALETLARVRDNHFMVTINRGSYYQTALLIRKGGFDAMKAQGLPAFRDLIASIEPGFSDVVLGIGSWEHIKLLSVQVNRLQQWYKEGLLCIGDAAHAMSPIGGVGINLAVQDAVATANLLVDKLHAGNCTAADFAKVQTRREWPAKMTQRLQIMAHRRFFSGTVNNRPLSVSRPLQVFLRLCAPLLRKVLSRIIGIGFRPEHIKTHPQQP
jgi:2-polyprenyl-6-methoxyphenol hydroxylase-like FAD-dependent oxidoreductase